GVVPVGGGGGGGRGRRRGGGPARRKPPPLRPEGPLGFVYAEFFELGGGGGLDAFLDGVGGLVAGEGFEGFPVEGDRLFPVPLFHVGFGQAVPRVGGVGIELGVQLEDRDRRFGLLSVEQRVAELVQAAFGHRGIRGVRLPQPPVARDRGVELSRFELVGGNANRLGNAPAGARLGALRGDDDLVAARGILRGLVAHVGVGSDGP